MNNKTVVILLGPPGSGKGTQSSLLSDKFGLYYFETSKILERAFNKAKKGESVKIGREKYFLEKQKQLWKNGALCDPPFVSYLVKKEIIKLYKTGESLVLAGSPRTLGEGRALMPVLEKLYNKNHASLCSAEPCSLASLESKKNIRVVLIDIPAKETIFRNSHRRICELMRHPILYIKETKNLKICPLDGSKLVKRKGLDEPETIKVRLKEYKERTLPLVHFLEKRKIKVKKINGIGSVSQIFRRILNSLEKVS